MQNVTIQSFFYATKETCQTNLTTGNYLYRNSIQKLLIWHQMNCIDNQEELQLSLIVTQLFHLKIPFNSETLVSFPLSQSASQQKLLINWHFERKKNQNQQLRILCFFSMKKIAQKDPTQRMNYYSTFWNCLVHYFLESIQKLTHSSL